MNSSIIKFLKDYSTEEHKVNSLIISSFITNNNLIINENTFLKEYLINEKSKSRKALETFNTIITKQGIDFNTEFLIELFEFIVSPEDKIINGAVYTPLKIREHIVRSILDRIDTKELKKLRIGDISCGCGGFLATVAENLRQRTGRTFSDIYRTNLFGLDIEHYSIQRTKILLSLLALKAEEDREIFEFNLFIGDALNFDWKSKSDHIKKNKGFDVIVGNPPYVCSRNIKESSLKLLENWSVTKSGHPDLYIPFFQVGIELLTKNGILGYITVNTFFKSINGRSLREYFSSNLLNIQIIDFGGEQLFKARTTYTCICFIWRSNANHPGKVFYVKSSSSTIGEIQNENYSEITYDELDDFAGWNINSAKIRKIIYKLENSGKRIEDIYCMRTGIATLRNDIYKFTPESKKSDYYCFKKNEVLYQVEKLVCRDVINSNILKNESDINELKEKIIFPYSMIDNKPVIFSDSFFKTNYPLAYRYLLSNKTELAKRDKAKKKYEKWFAYGRNQSLDIVGYKLFYPHICSGVTATICTDLTLLFYNGEAIISQTLDDLVILKKIMESKLFWFYVSNSSKPYSSGFFSLSKNYIKKFSIPEFSEEEKLILIKEQDKQSIDEFLARKYRLPGHYLLQS